MKPVKSYAAHSPSSPLIPHLIHRRNLQEDDVEIDIMFCGICHSDIHSVRNDWGSAKYPLVPGHEIIGKVSAIGDNVRKFKVGDLVGVGCLVDACMTCPSCAEGLENYCKNGSTGTYNSPDKILGGTTFGGYSTSIVVKDTFVLSIPENLDPAATAPLLCAGITSWSPMAHWNVKAGEKVGIIGLGGLGHMGVKFAHAMGAHVVMITTSTAKGNDALALGADEVLISTNNDHMQKHLNSFDFLLNTIPVGHDPNPYIQLLKRDATMVFVGAIEPLESINGKNLIYNRKRVAGSLIGGIKETQEMLDFCGQHNIVSDIEVINIQEVNEAYEKVVKGAVKYRFVIDMQSLKTAEINK